MNVQYHTVPNFTLVDAFIADCIAEWAKEQQQSTTQETQLLITILSLLHRQVWLHDPNQLLNLSREQFQSLQIPFGLELKIKQKLMTLPLNTMTVTTVVEEKQHVLSYHKISMGISWLGYVQVQGPSQYHFIAEQINLQLKNYCRMAVICNCFAIGLAILQILLCILLYIISGLFLNAGSFSYYYSKDTVVGITLISFAATIHIFVMFIYPILVLAQFIFCRIVLLRKVKQIGSSVVEKSRDKIRSIKVKYYENIFCSPTCCYPLVGKKIVVETCIPKIVQ